VGGMDLESARLDEGCAQVVVNGLLGYPERTSDANRRKVTGVHHAIDGHLGYTHHRRHLGDGQEIHLGKGGIDRADPGRFRGLARSALCRRAHFSPTPSARVGASASPPTNGTRTCCGESSGTGGAEAIVIPHLVTQIAGLYVGFAALFPSIASTELTAAQAGRLDSRQQPSCRGHAPARLRACRPVRHVSGSCPRSALTGRWPSSAASTAASAVSLRPSAQAASTLSRSGPSRICATAVS